LLILAVIYVPFYIWVWRSPNASKHGFVKYGPMVMYKTKLGTRLMERWCIYTRFWRFFGTLSLVISAVLMGMMVFMMVIGISNLPSNLSAPGLGLEYALAIPGLNPLLPIWYGILGLAISMIIHELAHGMQTRSNDMRVESTGLLLAVVPMGAFVEPNSEDVDKSSRRAKLDLFSAGIATNFIAAVIFFMLFAVIMLGGISSPYGDNAAVNSVTNDSPAYHAGMPAGAIILDVNGYEYHYSDDYTITYSWNPGDAVAITYLTKDGEETKDVIWGLYIERIVTSSPADHAGISSGTYLVSLEYSGDDPERYFKVDLYGAYEFTNFMSTTLPGETVTATIMDPSDGSIDTVTFDLGQSGSIGYMGITTTTSGMGFITPDILLEKARNPLFGADSISDGAMSILKYFSGPFTGFSPMPEAVMWWYDVPFEDFFWIIVTAFYWIFWFNIMLGVTNAIPAFPFDGGYIFLGWLNALLEKLGIKDAEVREDRSYRITSSISYVVVFMFIMMVVAVVL